MHDYFFLVLSRYAESLNLMRPRHYFQDKPISPSMVGSKLLRSTTKPGTRKRDYSKFFHVNLKSIHSKLS